MNSGRPGQSRLPFPGQAPLPAKPFSLCVLTSNPRPRKGAILAVQLNADIVAVKGLCRKPRRTAAEKGVKDNAAFGTACQDTGFRQLRRERGEMPAPVWDGVYQPHVPPVAHGGDKGGVVVAAAPCLVQALHLALSRYLGGILAACAAAGFVPCRRFGGGRLRNCGGVIVILL